MERLQALAGSEDDSCLAHNTAARENTRFLTGLAAWGPGRVGQAPTRAVMHDRAPDRAQKVMTGPGLVAITPALNASERPCPEAAVRVSGGNQILQARSGQRQDKPGSKIGRAHV